ncbi:MAG: hypothetical protein U0U09_16735 [Cyclobacteriaceae bacterium]
MQYKLIILAVFIPFTCLGQVLSVNEGDSLRLIQKAKEITRNLIENNPEELKRISLEKIYCQPCYRHTMRGHSPFLVSTDQFSLIDHGLISRLSKSIEVNNPLIVLLTLKGSEFENELLKRQIEVTIYEIIYPHTQPNQIPVGNEKPQPGPEELTALQFVKLNNEFKLYGITTIPVK